MRISDWSSDVCSSDLIVPGDRLPVLWRDDYVQNSNDSAWLSNPEAPLTGYPAIVSEEGVVQGGRTRMGIAQIEARSDERRVGKECVSTCRSRGSRYH